MEASSRTKSEFPDIQGVSYPPVLDAGTGLDGPASPLLGGLEFGLDAGEIGLQGRMCIPGRRDVREGIEGDSQVQTTLGLNLSELSLKRSNQLVAKGQLLG